MLARLYEARDLAQGMGGSEPAEAVAEQLGADAQRVLSLGRDFEKRFYAALDDDFNTAQALGYTFELARAINRFGNHKKARKRGGPIVAPALEALTHVTSALSLLGMDTASFQEEVKAKRLTAMGISREDVERKVDERMQARADKDWARADALRDELAALQVLVMDTADGCEWRVRLQAPDGD